MESLEAGDRPLGLRLGHVSRVTVPGETLYAKVCSGVRTEAEVTRHTRNLRIDQKFERFFYFLYGDRTAPQLYRMLKSGSIIPTFCSKTDSK